VPALRLSLRYVQIGLFWAPKGVGRREAEKKEEGGRVGSNLPPNLRVYGKEGEGKGRGKKKKKKNEGAAPIRWSAPLVADADDHR